MKLRNTKGNAHSRLKMLIYGFSGVGKTTLIGSIGEPVLMVSFEAGDLVLAEKDIALFDAALDDDDKLVPLEKRISRIREIYTYAQTPEALKKYKWIAIDSLTELSQNLLAYLKTQDEYKPEKMALKMWGAYNDELTKLVKAFRDLPHYNVLITCLAEKDKDDNGMTTIGLKVQGKISNDIPSYFDEVLYAHVHKDADGKRHYRLLTNSTDTILAKDRSGKLDDYEPANIQAIANKIRGVKA